MFARNISIVLKPNTLIDFTKTFENDVLPILRKQSGFRDEIILATDDARNVTAISLWDTQEQSETYANATYPGVLKVLDKFIDGPPKVRVSSVIHSTLHKLTPAAVVAA